MARQKPPQAEVKVDLSKADTIKCDDCGNYLFITAHVIKRLSAIISPTGQEALIPVAAFACEACSHINKEFEDAELDIK